jgi:hypothetical protein
MRTYLSLIALVFLIFCNEAEGRNYSVALDKARKALYIQSGMKSAVRKAEKSVMRELEHIIEEFEMKEEVAITLSAYYIYSKRQVMFKYRNNVFKLSPNSVQLTFPIEYTR